jgi:hypothetical protein
VQQVLNVFCFNQKWKREAEEMNQTLGEAYKQAQKVTPQLQGEM